MPSPIIQSLLDTDFYKLTMQQAIFHHYPDAIVRADFVCRADVKLAPLADCIREQIDALSDIKLTSQERSWLESQGLFSADYLDWLQTLTLDPQQVSVTTEQGRLLIGVSGLWCCVTLFEIYILAIVSQLYGQKMAEGGSLAEGRARLAEKIDWLKRQQTTRGRTLHFVDFGTRRRHSREWQREVVHTLQRELGQSLQGTSNVMLARELDLTPQGTMGHEWLQAHQALVSPLNQSQKRALQIWSDEWQGALNTALTDTISMSAFLNDFDYTLAKSYKGLRHDSGSPLTWGERALDHLNRLGLSTQERTLVFSDNITFKRAVAIQEHFYKRCQTRFGIGTWLTNDVGSTPLPIVLKMTECNGQPVAKISDEPAKTLCLQPEFIEKLRAVYAMPEQA